MLENGTSYLHIDDTCRYWALDWDTHHLLSEVRSGLLTADEALALGEQLQIDRWRAWEGNHSFPGQLGGDIPPGVLILPNLWIACTGGCFWPGAPTELAAIYAKANATLASLYEKGSPLTGDMWITVVDLSASLDTSPSWPFGNATWPFPARPVDELVRSIESPFKAGEGVRVPMADAPPFRTLRLEQRGEKYSPKMYGGFIPVRASDGRLLGLYMRDAVGEFENDKGIIVREP